MPVRAVVGRTLRKFLNRFDISLDLESPDPGVGSVNLWELRRYDCPKALLSGLLGDVVSFVRADFLQRDPQEISFGDRIPTCCQAGLRQETFLWKPGNGFVVRVFAVLFIGHCC